jgi:hypothetical protein
MSAMTVSVFGQDDVPLEEAIDDVFKQIQQRTNYIQSGIRALSAVPEQDNDYMHALEIYTEIEDNVSALKGLFSEADSVSRQVLGKAPASLKEEVKTYKANIKLKRQQEKDRAKNERTEEKKE